MGEAEGEAGDSSASSERLEIRDSASAETLSWAAVSPAQSRFGWGSDPGQA